MAILVALIVTSFIPVTAATPYANYFLTADGWALPTPAAYVPDKIIEFKTVEEGKLKNPKDIFIADNGNIYIADSGNNRIVVLSPEYEFLFDIKGEGPNDPSALSDPTCVYVDPDGTILVVDAGNKRLVEFTERGNFRYSYLTPEDELLGEDFSYQPQKVIKDNRGYIYVTSVGEYRGIILLGPDGEFRNFFGTNKVILNFWDALARLLWSREDRKGQIVNLPYTFSNIYISEDQYVYATTTNTTAQLRKINFAGADVLYDGYNFNDSSIIQGAGQSQVFIDVTVDKNNNMYLIDSTYGRIYQFDEWGQNLFVFGSLGTGYGQYSQPTSIEVDDQGRVYVVDSRTGVITVFKPTAFAQTVHNANKLFSEGDYDESYAQWQKVLDQDNYYRLALQSMGTIHMRKDEFKEAMKLYYEAEDPDLYSTAFEEQRAEFIKRYFSIIATVAVLLLIGISTLVSFMRRRRRKLGPKPEKITWYTPIKNFFKRMVYVARHPIDGFDEIRYEGMGYYGDMFGIMILYVISELLSIVFTSFIYRDGVSLDMIDWGSRIVWALMPWIVVVIVNYGVTTIMYGEGRFRDIIIGGAFCHVPFILTSIPLAILTNVLGRSEAQLFTLANTFISIYVGLMVYFCIKGVHGFHPLKGVVVTILTAVGVTAVSALFMIVYGLAVQMFDFFIQIGKELSYIV